MTGRKTSFALILALSAFVFAKAEKIKTENSIGLEYPARIENRAQVFNGDFNLGTAGFSIKQALDSSICFDPKIKNELQTETREDGKGKCLKINSINGSPYFILMGREVYIPKPMKLKFTFDAKLQESPGAGKTLTLRVDFRHTNPGRIRDSKKKYSISGGSFKLNGKWKKCTVNVKAKKAGYYRFCFFTDLSPENSLPTVLIDSISIKSNDGSFGAEVHPQAAIYTDKGIPAYEKGKEVKYTIKAILPGQTDNSAGIDLVFYNEQTKEIAFTKKVVLKKNADNVFEGQTSIIPPKYGAFAPLAKYNGKTIDSFGGETLVFHPVCEHAKNDLASRLAVNFHVLADVRRGQPESDKRLFWNSSAIHSEKIEDQFQIMKKGGIKAVNLMFRWKDLEPEKGKWDFSNYDKTIELCKKNGIKIMAILGAHFSMNKRTGKPLDLPAWIVKYSKKHKITPFHNWEGVLPPVNLWNEYCKKIATRYRDMIVDMEVLGEPKAWCTPEEYMIYLKASQEAIHSVAPEIPVIGVCPTGDGDSPRFMEWSEAVLKQGAEKYMDGFSYHPYGASNDFQTGDYFEATATINKVKALLKNPRTGMWNTECFQLPNSKRKRCDRWDASTALRHYLICLGNDIKMIAAYDLYLLRKDRLNPHVRMITPWIFEKIPAPVNAAANFLSYILKDATNAEILNVNNFARTYVFSNKSGTYAVGALWYLRPEGGSWTRPGKYKGIKIFDMFGNPVSSDSLEMKLNYNPLYVTGSKSDVENCIKKSEFIPLGKLVDIKGRLFENNLYLDAKNLLGKSENISIKLNKKEGFVFPEFCNFIFEKNINNSSMLQNICDKNNFELKELSYKTLIGGKSFSDGKVDVLPKTKCYSLPEKNIPLNIELERGTQISMTVTKEGLEIITAAKDKEIVAAEKNLWLGDSVEIFIDASPMEKLDQESNGIIQYVFSVKPSISHGEKFWANKKLSVKPESSVKITESGYILTVKIPWKEILPESGPAPLDIIGVDVYVNNFSANGKNEAETLSRLPGSSCRQRFHYPLFRLPQRIKDTLIEDYFSEYGISCVKNAEFMIEKGNRNKPKYWFFSEKEFCKYGDFGQGGKKGMKILPPVGFKEKMPLVSQKVPCVNQKGKSLIIEALVKLDIFKGKDPNAMGFVIFFYDKNGNNIGGGGYGQKLKCGEAFDWSIFQISKRIPENASNFTVSLGLPRGFSNGSLYIDHVRMKIAE